MYVSPINNVNFNGRFKKTAELDKLLKCSDSNTLHRFNEVLKQAGKVNDRKVFKISSLAKSRFENRNKITTMQLHLLSYPEQNELKTTMEHMIAFEYNHDTDKYALFENYENAMKSFVTTLENVYPQTDYKKIHDELVKKINRKLI